jgi:PIN domain nuclease of toxin-antitoxin system
LGSRAVIVLDTHVVIWDALAPQRLSARARQALALANEQEGVLICDISLWEIAMLIEKKRVLVDISCQAFINLVLQANKTIVHPITPEIATLAAQLPEEISKDPADRLIASAALAENATLVTADTNLQASPLIPTLW